VDRPGEGIDRAVAALAGRQHGVIARWQLLRCGVTSRTIDRRLADGRLHRFEPPVDGAYLVGHAVPPPWARETAVLLVCGSRESTTLLGPGDSAVLSHGSALGVYGLAEPARIVEVTIVAGRRVSRAGVRAHAVQTLPRGQLRRMHGLAVTSPARTIVDQAARWTPDRLERIVDAARIARLVTDAELDDALRSAAGRRGTRTLARLLDAERGTGYSRSHAERDLLRIVREAGLPLPRRNVRVLGHERDAVWDEERVVVEIDGWTFHWTPRRASVDDRRDAELHLGGWTGIRLSARTLRERPGLAVARIAAALATSPAQRG
jgi:very-short-patch-repair endonuclease